MSHFALRVFAMGLSLSIACGPQAQVDDDGADASTDPCSPGETRCSGNSYQECVNGLYEEKELCLGIQVCDPSLACVDCRPSSGDVCVGTQVHTCEAGGTIGGLVEECGDQGCTAGHCSDDGCADGAELIYVVDDSYRLWSFDPTKVSLGSAQTFSLIGNLSCSAGVPLGDWPSPATPFSMSVDRNAKAWVLYTSGEIFLVDTETASCANSGYSVGQGGYELFGMGFVSDSPGSNAETLFVSGGGATATGAGNLGRIDPGTLTLTNIGALPTADYSPELTGTGDAQLFGYYPSDIGTNKVTEISKTNASNLQTWNLAAACSDAFCTIRAWAFAHWGGQFYIFVTTADGLTLEDTAKVVLLDPDTGTNNVIAGFGDTGNIVVGAGVSTCAPIYVP